MKCQQQLSVRSSAGVLEAPSGYALRCLQDIKAKRTVYLLQNRTSLFATNTLPSRNLLSERKPVIQSFPGIDGFESTRGPIHQRIDLHHD